MVLVFKALFVKIRTPLTVDCMPEIMRDLAQLNGSGTSELIGMGIQKQDSRLKDISFPASFR